MKKVLIAGILIMGAFLLFGCTQGGTSGGIDMNKLTSAPAGVLGSNSAPVKVIEYSDYQCPFCREWFNESKAQLVNEYVNSGKVQFIFKDYPLSSHPQSLDFANAVRCAGAQGKYFEMHDKLYSEQDKIAGGQYTLVTSVSDANLVQWANDIGIDSQQFASCLADSNYTNAIADNAREASSIGIRGTPSFVIGKANGSGELLVGVYPYSTLKSKIDALLSQSS